jgi:hypothetical protein
MIGSSVLCCEVSCTARYLVGRTVLLGIMP